MKGRPHNGFTLIELIIVILLIAIVSLYAASRYTGVGNVSAFAVQEQLISVIRQVQVNRMQSNVTNLYSYCSSTLPAEQELKTLCLKSRLSLSATCVGSSEACALSDLESRSDGVRVEEVSFTSSPAVGQIEFSLVGNPLNAASAGVSINISGSQSNANICINQQGYISAGACL